MCLLTCKICVLPTPGAPKNTTFSGPWCHDVSFSPDPSRVNRYAEWCAIRFFCIKSSISMEIRPAHRWFTFTGSTNLMLFWWIIRVWPLIMTAFRFFSVDGDKGNVLPFHIFFRVRVILFICVYRIWLQNDARKSRKLSECDQMVDGGWRWRWEEGVLWACGVITGNFGFVSAN